MLSLLVALSGVRVDDRPHQPIPEAAVRAALQAYRGRANGRRRNRACARRFGGREVGAGGQLRPEVPSTPGHAYSDTEPIHVRRWKITAVVVRGDHATEARSAPGRHVVERRLTLVREADGWKLERDWRRP